jgi:hypothetical protein
MGAPKRNVPSAPGPGRAFLAITLLLIAGCGFRPEKLAGLSLDEVKERLGPPTRQDNNTVPPTWDGAMGPRPTLLKPGDKYIGVLYADYQGQQIQIFAVSPPIYQRVKGASPGNKDAYVLEVYTFPKGTVF